MDPYIIHGWDYSTPIEEMMPLLRAHKMASTPYSPLAAGRLARDWSDTTKRFETDEIARAKYDFTRETDQRIV